MQAFPGRNLTIMFLETISDKDATAISGNLFPYSTTTIAFLLPYLLNLITTHYRPTTCVMWCLWRIISSFNNVLHIWKSLMFILFSLNFKKERKKVISIWQSVSNMIQSQRLWRTINQNWEHEYLWLLQMILTGLNRHVELLNCFLQKS